MGINRNIVECKVLCLSFQTDPHSVLIETSWNVKDYESRCESVKEYSINRNIVECKGCITAVGSRHNVVLIETSWNVKCISMLQFVIRLMY